jgi:tetratricopeptide (TPR) repeat protein
MLDRFDEARELLRTLGDRQRGVAEWDLNAATHQVAELAGDYDNAAAALRELCVQMETSGQTAILSTVAPLLGRVLCALGRHDEAEPLARQGRDLGDPTDILTQAHWRRVQALVYAHRGEHSEAERLALEAVAYAELTDSLQLEGDTLADLAEVCEMAGRRDEAAAALHEALDRYERKGIVPLARRMRERLAALQETPI